MKCCNGCVPPKRHKACWGHCTDYIKERAEYDKLKAVEDKKNAVRNSIYVQKASGALRASKRRGKNRKT